MKSQKINQSLRGEINNWCSFGHLISNSKFFWFVRLCEISTWFWCISWWWVCWCRCWICGSWCRSVGGWGWSIWSWCWNIQNEKKSKIQPKRHYDWFLFLASEEKRVEVIMKYLYQTWSGWSISWSWNEKKWWCIRGFFWNKKYVYDFVHYYRMLS